MRQIHAAIVHYERQDYECAITLAAAGEGILPSTDKPYFWKKVEELEVESPERTASNAARANDIITWLKHGTIDRDGPRIDRACIEVNPEVVVAIYRGITKFEAVYGFLTPQMIGFLRRLVKDVNLNVKRPVKDANFEKPGFGEW